MSSRAVAPLPHRRRIPMPAICNVVQQVTAHFQPEKVILFGSYAYGHPLLESRVSSSMNDLTIEWAQNRIA